MDENKVMDWSQRYGISKELLEQIVSSGTKYAHLRCNSKIAYSILRTDSFMLQEFLKKLPPFKEEAAETTALSIDFLFPYKPTWNYLFSDQGDPSQTFGKEETAQWVWDAEGGELYEGETEKKKGKTTILLPAYVQCTGFSPRGSNHLLNKHLNLMLREGYFVSAVDLNKRTKPLRNAANHSDAGNYVEHHVLGFNCYRGYALFGRIYTPEDDDEDLSVLWDSPAKEEVKRLLSEFQAKFLQRDPSPPIPRQELMERFRKIGENHL